MGDDDPFPAVVAKYGHLIDRWSRVDVVGLDRDDVRQEVTICLWKAWTTWKAADGPLETYWWSIWVNRKANLIAQWMRKKRPCCVYLEPDDLQGLAKTLDPVMETTPECPGGSLAMMAVWKLIALGYTPSEIRQRLGITKHCYYSVMLPAWRNDSVRSVLAG